MSISNSSRALEQVVSVDGWIGEFDEEGNATVHADVVFREGYFGDAPESLVRFKVSLTRAEVVLCIPNGEPLRIIRKSVHRTPKTEGGTRQTKKETTLEGELGGQLGIDKNFIPKAGVNVAGSAATKKTVTEEQLETISEFLEQHFNTLDKNPAWEVWSSDGTPMSGAPWNANDRPRMKISKTADMDQPFIRVEIRCRRQDLYIDGLELKDPEKNGWFKSKPDRERNLAAAEQVIKEELVSAGFLNLGELDESHKELLIADVVITED